jgi:DNA-binding MarR family transcriptional regulator
VAKTTATTVDRDQQILNRLGNIEHKVDSMEQTQAFALRAESEKLFGVVKGIFKNGKRRAQIYLAANGSRGVQEIAEHLKMQRQNVGPDLKRLAGEGMLEIADSSDGRDIWAKRPFDRSLRITAFLQKAYSLSADGRPVVAKKRNAKKKK